SVRSERLVKTVTARSDGRLSRFRTLSAQAFIISLPPEACNVKSETPRFEACSTASATTLGMSWNFKSKNRLPCCKRSQISEGPVCVNNRIPILKNGKTGDRRAARSSAADAVSRSSATMTFLALFMNHFQSDLGRRFGKHVQ